MQLPPQPLQSVLRCPQLLHGWWGIRHHRELHINFLLPVPIQQLIQFILQLCLVDTRRAPNRCSEGVVDLLLVVDCLQMVRRI